MNYDKIIDATYKWISLEKLIWFLLFFWLALPVLFLVPTAIELGFFYYKLNWIVEALYVIMYLAVLLGLMVLTCSCLNHKKINSDKVSVTKYIDTIFLAVLELWYIFVWNIHKSYRFTQILLIIGILLLSYYESISQSLFGSISLLIFLICYGVIVIYNAVRLSFSMMVFYSKKISLNDTISQSWHLTHKKFWSTFFSYIFVIASSFALFIVFSIILWFLAYLLLSNYFIIAVAQNLSSLFSSMFALVPAMVAYYFGVTEIFYQLNNHHESNNKIKNILANRVLAPQNKIIIPLVNKKVVKKKASKKVVKKKVTKKVVKKKKK
ncbi:MAG: hypothetical protein WC915_04885 [archaeon]|jgi:hypothetical protein